MTLNHAALPPKTLAALVEASATINNSLDLRATLQAIAQMAANVMQAEASSVILLDAAHHKLVFLAATGGSADDVLGEEFDAGLGIAGKVVSTGEPVLVTDVRQDQAFFNGIDAKSLFKTRGLVAAPLIKAGKICGVVEVLNRIGSDNFTTDDLSLLQIFATLAASAITNTQAHEQLKSENRALLVNQTRGTTIVGSSPALQRVLE
ncbi:MAG: GAF domain-containing protein, partial [Phycisphaerae bacterium]|nr:GAF domain-containing protein [Phycisphaerae bacterium]